MSLPDVPIHSIASLAAAYRAGSVSTAAAIAEVYRRIAAAAAIDPAIWILLRDQDDVLAEAAALGSPTDPTLPLFGIPFAVKDNIHVAGLPTTAACPEFAATAAESGPVVLRLQRAGALLIGKTNLDQFATGLVGTRSPWGAPRSPFDPRYISGGSSSGSAVAVARGLVAFALGTDTAGSGRVPAAMNNIIGLKPTKGILSTVGVVPACRSLDCVSVFASTADDAASVLAVAATRAAPLPIPPERFRVGIPRHDQLVFCGDTAAEVLFHATVGRARSLGGMVVEIDFQPFFDVARSLYEGPWVAERTAAVGQFLADHPTAGHPVVRGIIDGGRQFTAADMFTAMDRLEAQRAVCDTVWDAVDVLLVPTAPTTYTVEAVEADPVRLNATLGTYTNFVNLLDLAAVALPSGFTPAGIPHGVTLIGPAQSDAALLALADSLHRAAGPMLAGATGHALPPAARRQGAWATLPRRLAVAVVGAHMEGLPLNHQLVSLGGRLLARTKTAPLYRLHALTGKPVDRPGMVRVATDGRQIEVEVWDLPSAALGSFIAQVAAPLTIGWVTLADGQSTLGFLCEGMATVEAPDITAFGGWRAYLDSASGKRLEIPRAI